VRDLELVGVVVEDERLGVDVGVVADALVVEGLALAAAMMRAAGSA
jgi:hypothetical protein